MVGYFIYKEWPDFQKRVSSGAVKTEKEKIHDGVLDARLCAIETKQAEMGVTLDEIKYKLGRDFDRINDLEKLQKKNEKAQDEGQEELEVIMRALLGVLRGLQEQGANGPTKTAEAELQDYLNRKAHKTKDDEEG